MAAASIRVTMYASPGGLPVGLPTVDLSREDLMPGYQIQCESVYAASTYSWTLAFTPDSAGPATGTSDDYAGTPSNASLLPPQGSTLQFCKFNVDWAGSYLIRLVVDAGQPTESTMFLRLRALTLFGCLKLVAAGERRDGTGVVPADASPEGWANDQNQNMLRILAFLRRTATSGRTLYVDANKGRKLSADPNDPTNIVLFPGPDSANRDTTGIRAAAVGFGDFSSINDAISYASLATSREEDAPSSDAPYWVVIQPGLYEENLRLVPGVHLVAAEAGGTLAIRIPGGSPIQSPTVRVRTVTSSSNSLHIFTGGSSTELCCLKGITLESWLPVSSSAPCTLALQGGALVLDGCGIQHWEAGPCIAVDPSAPQDNILLLQSCSVTSQNASYVFGTGLDFSQATSALIFAQESTVEAATTLWCRDGELTGSEYQNILMTGCVLSGGNGATPPTYKISGLPSDFSMINCIVSGDMRFSTSSATHGASLSFLNSTLQGGLSVDGTGTSGDVTVALGGSPLASGLTLTGVNVSTRVYGNAGGAGAKAVTPITGGGSPYSVQASDEVLLIATGSGAQTLTLPYSPAEGEVHTIKDSGGNASGHNITLQGNGNHFEGGGTSVTMNTNYEFRTYVFNGSGIWLRIG